ncbi:MAG TPA: hypothetical protein PK339_06215 [Flavitalea sp.]|nr:hypothetical protein [Flavitalea sp.]
MKRNILLWAFVAAVNVSAFAQPMAVVGSVEYQKDNKSAAVIELPYKTDIVEGAIKDFMAKKGVKETRSKGFLVYKGASLSAYDAEVSDLYFKVDKKGRRDKDISMIYLIAGRANENVAVRNGGDNYKMEEAKTFLNDLVPAVEAHDLDVSIGQQADLVQKAEKKLKNLRDDQSDYEKKIRSFEDKLAQNKKDQENQLVELNKLRASLDAMQARKKL